MARVNSQSTNDIEGAQIQPRRKHILGPLVHGLHLLKTHLIIPSAFRSYHQVPMYSFIVPTRLEAIVVYGYWAFSLILCCANNLAFNGDLYYTSVPQQVWEDVADRTGVLALANLALIWLFAGRNNIFQWTTGWNFATFNLFHRHVARIATIQATVHSVCYTVIYVNHGYYKEEFPIPFFYFGVLVSASPERIICFDFSNKILGYYYDVTSSCVLFHLASEEVLRDFSYTSYSHVCPFCVRYFDTYSLVW
jgi:hypothetical protein